MFRTMGMAMALAASAAPGVPQVMPDRYSLICSGSLVVGLNWRNDEWVSANFKPSNYIVMKTPDNFCAPLSNPNLTEIVAGSYSKDVCINIRRQSEKYNHVISGKCTEYYSTRDGDSISCDNIFNKFSANFDGWFHMTVTNGDTRERGNVHGKDIKDSMYIEVGHCSKIV